MPLVDYFVEVVADAAGARLCMGFIYVISSSLFPIVSFMHAAQRQKCEHVKRRIVVRMPLTDHEDFALPDGVPFVRTYMLWRLLYRWFAFARTF